LREGVWSSVVPQSEKETLICGWNNTILKGRTRESVLWKNTDADLFLDSVQIAKEKMTGYEHLKEVVGVSRYMTVNKKKSINVR